MSDFKAKMHQIQLQTTLGNLQHSPDSKAGFKGPTSKGGEARKEEGVRNGRGKGVYK